MVQSPPSRDSQRKRLAAWPRDPFPWQGLWGQAPSRMGGEDVDIYLERHYGSGKGLWRRHMSYPHLHTCFSLFFFCENGRGAPQTFQVQPILLCPATYHLPHNSSPCSLEFFPSLEFLRESKLEAEHLGERTWTLPIYSPMHQDGPWHILRIMYGKKHTASHASCWKKITEGTEINFWVLRLLTCGNEVMTLFNRFAQEIRNNFLSVLIAWSQ